MEEESKTTDVSVTVEQEVQSFIRQVINDILPTIDDPDPFLTVLGTLSILFNRIKYKNMVILLNQLHNLQIKMEDKYFNERVFEQFHQVLNTFVTLQSDDERMMSVINLSFIQLINIFLESYQYSVSKVNISMEQFDQTVAYEIDLVKMLE